MSDREPSDVGQPDDFAVALTPDAALPAAESVARRHLANGGAASLPLWQTRERRPSWPRFLAHLGALAVWCVMAALALIAVLRLTYHDGTHLLTCLNAFTLYLYLPAYVCLAWAAWRRRLILIACSMFVILCHLAWVGPDFVPIATSQAPPATSPTPAPSMRLFFANVRTGNPEYQALWNEIAEFDPDVVMLAECSRAWHRALRESPIMAPYVYRQERDQVRLGRIIWCSRLPVVDVQQHLTVGRWTCVLTVRLGKDTLRLFGLHAPRPMDYPWYDYKGYWRQVRPLLDQRLDPLVVVGDFNATQHSRVYRQLTSGRFHSAHEDRGRGYAVTWPNGQHWLPPIRIDQALLSADVRCLSIAEGRGRGSDHKPLVLDVQIRPAPQRATSTPVTFGGSAAPGGGPP